MNRPVGTIDTRTFAIGVLSITACILFVGLLMVTMQPAPAYGIGQTDRAGDYIMLTQQLTNSQEGVVIVDAASKQMTLYALNGSNKQLQVLHANIPLDALPGAQPGPGRQP
ncbi:unnamed protein product [marine sediment metagenome]|uniref:Uncharacterized protein n=1 Tax=marine sediment metagenome TaxID=412755 RepID=X0VJU5_9ZZZZ